MENGFGPWETVLPVIEGWQSPFERYHMTCQRVRQIFLILCKEIKPSIMIKKKPLVSERWNTEDLVESRE